MKNTLKKIIDILFSPVTFLAALWLKIVSHSNDNTMPFTHRVFAKLKVFPIRDHYYQPLVFPKLHLKNSLREDRKLPGINLNIDEQLNLLKQFNFNEELNAISVTFQNELSFHYNNGAFQSGDAEFLYNIIRLKKPARIIEIGSGMSTLMAINAVNKNKQEDKNYTCEHICIEPFEMPWLEKTNVKVVRKLVEEVDLSIFKTLEKNDILFIDSSHMIRPQGDVLTEFLAIVPTIKSGVLVHVHDIFTPKDYLDEWVLTEHRLWNEQYLLEAFLSFNNEFRIIGALNHLQHHYRKEIHAVSPILAIQKNREPGSFWMVRN